ncbi:MAG: hypothetical protein OXI54_11625 [Chloroflexota bacterium]|nr:hypothetical protein [Chloroflexota bacterium]MDE2684780.1 hypothetical protein [Chloroflexota bacterium]
MARDFHELVRERMNREPEFAAGLYQDCIDLLQSEDDEDRAVAEETLANYFDHEQARAARRLAANAAETTEPAANTAN